MKKIYTDLNIIQQLFILIEFLDRLEIFIILFKLTRAQMKLQPISAILKNYFDCIIKLCLDIQASVLK